MIRKRLLVRDAYLSCFGGMPMAMPVMSVDLELGPDLHRLIEEIQRSGIYGNHGPQAMKMESEYANLLGVPASRIVSASNATLALQGAMAVMRLESWVIPSWTFAATAHAAAAIGAGVAFGDVDAESWMLAPSQVSAGEGAVVTAPFGSRISIGEEWNHVAGLVVDAAAAIGAFPEISQHFERPWAAVISLHATKVLGIGEGGFGVFSSDSLAQRFRQWTNFGFLGSRSADFLGSNAKLSELSAAVAICRIARWPAEKTAWIEARRVVHEVGEELGVNPSFSYPDWVAPYWLARFNTHAEKNSAVAALGSAQIETRDWWSQGCHRMPAFARLKRKSSLPVTEALASTTLGLPFFRTLTRQQAEEVRDVILQQQ